jgi:hypothetical protein
MMLESTWKIRANARKEDAMLERYRYIKGGDIIAEVPVATRSLDGIHLSVGRNDGRLYCWGDLGGNTASRRREFYNIIQEQDIELIEIKPELNRGVLGQVIAGRDIFEEQYGVIPSRTVILFPKELGDSALVWVCKEKRNIDIEPLDYPVSWKRTKPNRISQVETPDKFTMLRTYQRRPEINGDIYTGIRIDDAVIWRGCHEDSVDAIRLLDSQKKGDIISVTEDVFRQRVRDCEVELIEMPRPLKKDRNTKKMIRALNRGVIGKVLAGKDMFERKYREQNIKVRQLVILCIEIDPSFKVVWEKEGILPLVV